MLVALCQINSSGDIEANAKLVESSIREAAAAGAELIVLPEATMHAFGAGPLTGSAARFGWFSSLIQELVRALSVTVVCGTFRPGPDGRVYNTALIARPHAELLMYDKMHLYDAFGFAESDSVAPGDNIVTFDVDGITFGVAICFDIRSPAFFKEMARRGAQAIIVPTSWTPGNTKEYQWKLLIRARALDSGCFILAADQGFLDDGRTDPVGVGYSAVIDPFGGVVKELGHEQGILYAEIDPAVVDKARTTLPVLEAD